MCDYERFKLVFTILNDGYIPNNALIVDRFNIHLNKFCNQTDACLEKMRAAGYFKFIFKITKASDSKIIIIALDISTSFLDVLLHFSRVLQPFDTLWQSPKVRESFFALTMVSNKNVFNEIAAKVRHDCMSLFFNPDTDTNYLTDDTAALALVKLIVNAPLDKYESILTMVTTQIRRAGLQARSNGSDDLLVRLLSVIQNVNRTLPSSRQYFCSDALMDELFSMVAYFRGNNEYVVEMLIDTLSCFSFGVRNERNTALLTLERKQETVGEMVDDYVRSGRLVEACGLMILKCMNEAEKYILDFLDYAKHCNRRVILASIEHLVINMNSETVNYSMFYDVLSTLFIRIVNNVHDDYSDVRNHKVIFAIMKFLNVYTDSVIPFHPELYNKTNANELVIAMLKIIMDPTTRVYMNITMFEHVIVWLWPNHTTYNVYALVSDLLMKSVCHAEWHIRDNIITFIGTMLERCTLVPLYLEDVMRIPEIEVIIGSVMNAMYDCNVYVRCTAIKALQHLTANEVLVDEWDFNTNSNYEILQNILVNDHEEGPQIAAAKAIVNFDPAQYAVMKVLLYKLSNDIYADVIAEIIPFFGRLTDPADVRRVLPILRDILDINSGRVRVIAYEACFKLYRTNPRLFDMPVYEFVQEYGWIAASSTLIEQDFWYSVDDMSDSLVARQHPELFSEDEDEVVIDCY